MIMCAPCTTGVAVCILSFMNFNAATYSYGDTAVHRVDARVKIALLVAYSVTLFCVHTWVGMAVCLAAFFVCAALSHLPFRACAAQLIPLWIVLVVALLANSFSLNVGNSAVPMGLGAVSAGVFERFDPIVLVGTFGFVPAGFARGCFYLIRIALLAFASMILTTTTSSTQITQALEKILSPLARLGVPTRDITTIVSIALRFMPVTFDEFQKVRAAQQSRGASFADGSITEKLRAWATVLTPLFVGMFRHADNLAMAMDVRCYGMKKETTQLNALSLNASSACVLVCGLLGCFAVSWFL